MAKPAAARPVTARIDKLLSSMGYGSRKDIARMAGADRITLDGERLSDVTRRIPVLADLPARMAVDDRPLDPVAGMVILLNKPLGVTCSHSDAGPLVYELLPPRWRQREPAISTVGRLDKETSGLLLLTDDGDLLHRIISPRRMISKTYHATLARPLTGDEAALFASGSLLLNNETKPLEPATLEVLSPTEALLTITEGRYHQVRRMFAACGNHVLALHRLRLGGLHLPKDLQAGSWRLLDPTEQQQVFE
ncbi:pseudouridine synthase [Xinfangfangia sp. D13-10-4-6]|uniref:pseudouridine synthase n=1 Tax=Pseudogemmobacter hezensis TaxID=2737662 RepID=UPI001555EC8A|nr:pseudouridine synthase [Pseudogemmobacter hezensis]NPD16803.1 pseudouridine synthase [Pseudogemmobacter hezensis]